MRYGASATTSSCIQVGKRYAQPPNAHGEPTSSPLALLRSRLQTPLAPPPPAPCESLQFASYSAPGNPESLPPPGTTAIAASPPPICPACPSSPRPAAA